MNKFIFGPVPSRRLGLSLGLSPLPSKTCNYACVYCQLGHTRQMTNKRQEFFAEELLKQELRSFFAKKIAFDVLTIVGEGEPTLYVKIGELLEWLAEFTDKPRAVITNGALLTEQSVRQALKKADLVLPSLDAYDEISFRKINRPHGQIKFAEVYKGLTRFSEEYEGQLWLEMMLIRGVNDSDSSLNKFKELLSQIEYQKLYLNTPVRPPTEKWVKAPFKETMQKAATLLGGVVLDSLSEGNFYSEIADDYEAVLSIIKRHPMNQHELREFLLSRKCENPENIFQRLEKEERVEKVFYKGYRIYRLV